MSNNTLSIFATLKTAGFSKGIKEMQTGLGKVSAMSKNVGRSLTTFVTGPIAAMATGMVKAAGDMEYMETQMATLTGSAEAGKKAMADLADFTAKTPFQIEGVQAAAKQLLASGTTVEGLRDQLQYLGDVAAATGVPIEELAAPLAKVQAQGKATMREINSFLARGINIMPELAKVTGMSMEEVKVAISKGQISAEVFNQALDQMNDAGGIAEGGMLALSKTMKGQMSTALDNIKLAAASFGEVLLPIVVKATEKVTELAQRFAALDEGTKKTILVVAGLAAALGPALMIFGSIAGAINNIRMVMQGLGMASSLAGGGLMAALGPALPVILAVAAAALLIYRNWDKITKYFTQGPGKEVWEQLQATWQALKGAAVTAFGAISDTVGSIFTAIMDIVTTVWGFIGDYIIEDLTMTFNFVFDILDSVLSYFENVFNAISYLLKGDFGTAAAYMANAMIDSAKVFVKALGFMATKGAMVVDEILSWFGVDSGLKEDAIALFDGIADYMDEFKLETPEVEHDDAKEKEAGERIAENVQEGVDSKPVVVTVDTEDLNVGVSGTAGLSGGDLALANAGTSLEALKQVKEQYEGIAKVLKETGDYEGWQEMLGYAEEAESRMKALKDSTQDASVEITESIEKMVENAPLQALTQALQAAMGAMESLTREVVYGELTIGQAFLRILATVVKSVLGVVQAVALEIAIMKAKADVMKTGGFGTMLHAAKIPLTVMAVTSIAKGLIPAFAEGGAVLGPTLAMVGEKPGSKGEAIIPFEKMGQFANMMGFGAQSTQNITVTGNLRGRDISLSSARGGRQRRRRH